MPRARALVAAVPQRVWTAVAGLVLLASLGVTLVLAAGLSTWQGAVTHSPVQGSSHAPGSVVTPPRSAVIVVPTPRTSPAAPPPAHPTAPTTVTVVLPPATPPVPAPQPPAGTSTGVPTTAPAPEPQPVALPPVTATPRVARGQAEQGEGRHVRKAKHANHGRHLGWFKNHHGHHG